MQIFLNKKILCKEEIIYIIYNDGKSEFRKVQKKMYKCIN